MNLKDDNYVTRFYGADIWVAIKELFSDLLGAFMPGIYFMAVLAISFFLFGYTLDSEIMRRIITHDKILKLVLPFFVLSFAYSPTSSVPYFFAKRLTGRIERVSRTHIL